MSTGPDPLPQADTAPRRRRRNVVLWSAATVLCGALWMGTRNGLFLAGALVYGATAVVLARRLGAPPPAAPGEGKASD